jgi:hypothetical protein
VSWEGSQPVEGKRPWKGAWMVGSAVCKPSRAVESLSEGGLLEWCAEEGYEVWLGFSTGPLGCCENKVWKVHKRALCVCVCMCVLRE